MLMDKGKGVPGGGGLGWGDRLTGDLHCESRSRCRVSTVDANIEISLN